MSDYLDDYDLDGAGSGFSGVWGNLYPGLRSSLIVWIVLLGLAIFNSLTGGSSAVVCYPVQILIYTANGALAGYFALGSGYSTTDLPRTGAIAGAIGWILPALFYFLVVFLLGVATLGIGFLGLAVWLLCGPIDLAVQASCGAVGAYVYGHFAGGSEDVDGY